MFSGGQSEGEADCVEDDDFDNDDQDDQESQQASTSETTQRHNEKERGLLTPLSSSPAADCEEDLSEMEVTRIPLTLSLIFINKTILIVFILLLISSSFHPHNVFVCFRFCSRPRI